MDAAAHDHALQEHAEEHHLTPYKVYVGVWMALIGLTGITILAAVINMKHMAIFVALLVACTKSTLVILYFMHIAFEKRVFWWFLLATIATYVTFVLLTFADYAFR